MLAVCKYRTTMFVFSQGPFLTQMCINSNVKYMIMGSGNNGVGKKKYDHQEAAKVGKLARGAIIAVETWSTGGGRSGTCLK